MTLIQAIGAAVTPSSPVPWASTFVIWEPHSFVVIDGAGNFNASQIHNLSLHLVWSPSIRRGIHTGQ